MKALLLLTLLLAGAASAGNVAVPPDLAGQITAAKSAARDAAQRTAVQRATLAQMEAAQRQAESLVLSLIRDAAAKAKVPENTPYRDDLGVFEVKP